MIETILAQVRVPFGKYGFR